MKESILREGGGFSLFGGEALLVSEDDLEALWSWGLERFGNNSIQTNGTLINERHIDVFKRYRVNVGISIDGPGELNDVRWKGNLEATRTATAKTESAIERLCREGIPPSIIVTLHRGNATADKLPSMHERLRRLARLGVRSARLHILEVDNAFVRQKYALSTEENLTALLSFYELQSELPTLRLDVFEDMRHMLLGQDSHTTCIWQACDPLTTRAVRGVEGNGQSSNCGRTNKDGIDFTKAGREGFERYLALYNTPQEYGGCHGCRFFLMCKGQCPGTAIDGDWRNRTEQCDVWKALYERLEGELLASGAHPVSQAAFREDLEAAFLSDWAAGRATTMAHVLQRWQQRPAPASARPHNSEVAA